MGKLPVFPNKWYQELKVRLGLFEIICNIEYYIEFVMENQEEEAKDVSKGVTFILFVVMNICMFLKKAICPFLRGLEGAWKHIRTIELKWKNR